MRLLKWRKDIYIYLLLRQIMTPTTLLLYTPGEKEREKDGDSLKEGKQTLATTDNECICCVRKVIKRRKNQNRKKKSSE